MKPEHIPPHMVETVARMKQAHADLGKQAAALVGQLGARETVGALLLLSAQTARDGGLSPEDYVGMLHRMMVVMGFDVGVMVVDDDGGDAPTGPPVAH